MNLSFECCMALLSHLETFNDTNFCIDYIMDYCRPELGLTLRAIINDKDLIKKELTTVFGSNVHSGPKMILFKQIGYSITIFFLLLTIALHVGIKDIRKVTKTNT